MGRLAPERIRYLFPQAKLDALVASYVTFGVGGKAAALIEVRSRDELVAAVAAVRRERWPYKLIAGGSNILWPDGFYPGVVIWYQSPDSPLVISGTSVECEAGLPLLRLVRESLEQGLAGLETLSGIPGTVGGAVVGNAGAYSRSIADSLVEVECWDGEKLAWLSNKSCLFGYRDSIFKHKDWVVLRARFNLQRGDRETLLKKSDEIIKIREKKYAPGLRCPGSFFKNVLAANLAPEVLAKVDASKIIEGKVPAGYLLEAVGARGMREGGIYVADFHGNLLVNDGTGTCADVKKLAGELKERVEARFGIKLEEEVRCF